MSTNTKIGIEAISFSVPKIYLPIKDLAIARDIEPAKLEKGLGLLKMSYPDIYQDVVTFSANALDKLISQEGLKPFDIDRIYIGTESGIDASKPIASYLIALMEQKFGEGTFEHCDAVDLTFACIGGVDALHNSLDFVRANPNKKAIVIATDLAKYDLNSGGEYTQGAGAVAVLVSNNPKIATIDNHIGVSTKGVFDFFKPKRSISKEEITGEKNNPEWFGVLESSVDIAKEQPIFDGQYSNSCYQDRIKGAYFNLKKDLNITDSLYGRWRNIIGHLPYSFQVRRMFSEIYALDGNLQSTLPQEVIEYAEKIKEIGKSEEYKDFVAEKIAPAEIASSNIGNMYTASLFMGLLSTLYYHHTQNNDIANEKFGFLAYGSGSKSKAFEATINANWKTQIEKTNLFEILENRIAIDTDTYENLHKKEQQENVLPPKSEWILDFIEKGNPLLLGAKYYKYID